MTTILVGSLTFEFEPNVAVEKYDQWKYYKKRFTKLKDGIKAVDLIAINNDVLYLIEVKDYRRHRRSKSQAISDEIIGKVFDTLAGLLPARCNATVDEEIKLARRACRVSKVRIIFHLEQPSNPSRLFPQAFNAANLQLKLRSSLKVVDPHLRVTSIKHSSALPWTVT